MVNSFSCIYVISGVAVTNALMGSAGTQPSIAVAPEPQLSITKRQRWIELGLVLLIAIVPLIEGAIVSLIYGTSPSSNLRIISGLLDEISCLLLLVYLLHRRGANLRSIGLDLSRWTDVLTGFGLAFAALLLSDIFSQFVYRAFSSAGHTSNMRDARVIFAGISPWLSIAYTLSSSFFEETIVRGYLTCELVALACPLWLATLASIVVQTSYHLYYGWGGAFIVSGTFIVFGLYFAASRRLLPVILGHLFVDLVAT